MPPAHADPAAARARRRRVVIATSISGTGLLGVSLSTKPGSPWFCVLTMGVAGTWAAGALGSGPCIWVAPRAGKTSGTVLWSCPHSPEPSRSSTAPRLARHIPPLDQAIRGVLRYADAGSTPLVLLTAYTNGVAEELFFRGALWSAVKDTHPVAKTTFAYAAVTAATRNPALVLGGAVVSVLFGLQRRASGGILAPALTHVTWSVLMLSYLPPPVPDAPAARGRSRLTRATGPRD